MVGDKLLFDVWGGNRAGLVTVLVQPIGPDQWFDRVVRIRFWERMVLRRWGFRRDR
jgi:predicted HAD superfamily phosphohydrolase YqeG